MSLSKSAYLVAVIWWGLAGALLLTLLVNAVETTLDRPDVHYTSSTGDCVRVLNYAENDRYSCDNLPSKYNKVWVF
jgi:hypothetical protein|tara:strand:+ start:572 stop:799 length:228 start_codon:yes stop_codon:yes gene_type:complete